MQRPKMYFKASEEFRANRIRFAFATICRNGIPHTPPKGNCASSRIYHPGNKTKVFVERTKKRLP